MSFYIYDAIETYAFGKTRGIAILKWEFGFIINDLDSS